MPVFLFLLISISLIQAAPLGYAAWSDVELLGVSEFEKSVFGDPDRDRLPNYVEFGAGTGPLVADGASADPRGPIRDPFEPGTVFFYPSRSGLAEVGSDFLLSNDLADWRSAVGEANFSTVQLGGVEYVQVDVPDGGAAPAALFGRVAWEWLGATGGEALLWYSFDGAGLDPSGPGAGQVSGSGYDASRIGSVASPSGVPNTIMIGGGGGDVTGEVPVSTWYRNDAPNDNKGDFDPFIGGIADTHDFPGVLSFDLSALAGATEVTSVTIRLPQEGGRSDNRSGSINDIAVTLQELTVVPTNAATWNTHDGVNAWPGGGGGLADAVGPSFGSNQFDLDLLGEDEAATATIVIPSSAGLEDLIERKAGGRVDFLWRVPLAEGGAAGTGRNFVVFDGSAPGSHGALDSSPRLEVDFLGGAPGDAYAQVPTDATTATLAAALVAGHFHEVTFTSGTPGLDLLSLTFDHLAVAGTESFTSSIAVFVSTDGFATAPTEAEVRRVSSVVVEPNGGGVTALGTVDVPLGMENVVTPLTVRFYFFDDVDEAAVFTGVDNVTLRGLTPGHLLIGYGFDGGQAAPTEVPAAGVSGGDFVTPFGGISAVNSNAYAPAAATGAALADALAAGDYHEVVVTLTDPEIQVLGLRYKHHGSATATAFTSRIAVFASTDGFATAPTAGEVLHVSTETVTTAQSETAPIAAVEIPLSLAGPGTLTLRFYYFDGTNSGGAFNRVDGVELFGDFPGAGQGALQTIAAENYEVHILNPGFRLGVTSGGCLVLPPHESSGLRLLGSAIVSTEQLGQEGETTHLRVTSSAGDTALVDLVAQAHSLAVEVTLENGQTGPISLRTGSPGPAAYGLADAGSFLSNANLAQTQQTFAIRNDGGGKRFLSSFVIWPREGVAGMTFDRGNGTVSVGPESYEMSNATAGNASQTFHYFVGSMAEIYEAHRETRLAAGYPGVSPKPVGFETGWESWDILRWNTDAQSCQDVVGEFLSRGYKIGWMVTGSGFWDNTDTVAGGGTTVSFGEFHPAKYPDPAAPGEMTLRDFATGNGIRWMIGQRTNFVKLGGPFVNPAGPGESGQVNYATSPDTQEGLDNGYFLKDGAGSVVELTSNVFPRVGCHLLDGNVPGAADWFKALYDGWGVDGVKEDTMMNLPDHTIYNAPMRAIANGGDFVMARCGAYSSPGTLTRVNDTLGANSMSLRCPINYLQYAAVGAPNVYSDTVGFGNMENVNRTLRHAWFLSLTAGFAVSNCPWNAGWSAVDEAKFEKVYEFHYRHAPYMYSAAVDSHATGYPYTMTPLPIAYPEDAATYDLSGSATRQFEWLLGESMLAAPVLHDNSGNSTTLDVYLPEGTWIDYESGMQYTGPATLEAFSMPHDKTPVFIGGKGVVVQRISEVVPLRAVVFPVALGGSSYTFHHPVGGESSIVNNNTGWNAATVVVSNTTAGGAVPFTADPTTGALTFEIVPGNDYALTGGE